MGASDHPRDYVFSTLAQLRNGFPGGEGKKGHLAALCRQAKFEQVKGARLTEFLDLVSAGVAADVPVDPATLQPPTWVGRILFRMALAAHLRNCLLYTSSFALLRTRLRDR